MEELGLDSVRAADCDSTELALIYLLERKSYRERVTELMVFYLMIHFPNGCNNWDWALPNLRAWNCIRVSQWLGDSITWPISAAFLDALAGRCVRSRTARTAVSSEMGCLPPGTGLTGLL